MSVAIVSSVYGGYDQPFASTEQTIPVEWVMVTDLPAVPAPWRLVHEPRPHLHPRLAAKVAKCRPDLYTDADVTIWIDASVVVNDPSFAEWCVAQLATADIAQIVHPERDTITDEAYVSTLFEKYAGQPVEAQAAHYVADGFPDGWGLWATGLIVRSNTYANRMFGDAWLREQMRWTWQDQLSEAPMLYRQGMKPVPLDTPLWRSEKFAIRRHASDL